MTVVSTSFAQDLSDKLNRISNEIPNVGNTTESERLGYFETMDAIHQMMQPLFHQVAALATSAGFDHVEEFVAAPRGMCQNILFAKQDDEGNYTDVAVAKNKKWGFMQLFGGKQGINETAKAAATREGVEEGNGPNEARKYRLIHLESEMGSETGHFVKGVNICTVSDEEFAAIKLGDDMAKNELVTLPASQFVSEVRSIEKPMDHAFDQRHQANYLASHNAGLDVSAAEFAPHKLTEKDLELVGKAQEFLSKPGALKADVKAVAARIQEFASELSAAGSTDGEWKSKANRDAVKDACQTLVDSVANKLLSPYEYETKKGTKQARHMKVQAAQAARVNGQLVPSWLTINQLTALQTLKPGENASELSGGMVSINGHSVSDGGYAYNISARVH